MLSSACDQKYFVVWRATGNGGGDVFGACMRGKNISGYTFLRNHSAHGDVEK